MAQQIQELINKIKQEGIEAAEQKSKELDLQAQAKAQKIIDEAKINAQKIVQDGKKEIEQMKITTQAALKQSSRDMLLTLKKEIENVLKKITQKNVNDSLTPDSLSRILGSIAEKTFSEQKENVDIKVLLSQTDLESLKNGIIAKLQKELKGKIVFQSRDDISKGFAISFDSGKSSFDFSDKSLADYIAGFVNEEVAKIIKEAI